MEEDMTEREFEIGKLQHSGISYTVKKSYWLLLKLQFRIAELQFRKKTNQQKLALSEDENIFAFFTLKTWWKSFEISKFLHCLALQI